MQTSADFTPTRRMTLFDAVVLIAALGIGFWVCRYGLFTFVYNLFRAWKTQLWAAQPCFLTWYWGAMFLRHAQPLAAILMLATLALRFVHPRPTITQMARHSGFTACVAASVAVCVCGVLNLATTRIAPVPGHEFQHYVRIALTPLGSEPGLTVLACWMMLGSSRTWQFERSWPDRFGTVLGVYWLAMIVFARVKPSVH